MKHGCSKCGKPVTLERASGGIAAYQCSFCSHVGVVEKPPRPSKYGNQKTECDGFIFDSKAEAERWQELCLMQQAGAIRNLRRQVDYPLEVNSVLVATYRADFVFEERDAHGLWETVVQDEKGHLTDVYKLKRKLVKALYGVDIRETKKGWPI